MLFPIIRIKDGGYGHIVGTNSHDMLFIKDNAIHYLSQQSMASTTHPEDGVTFDGQPADEDDLLSYPTVEMVTFEELVKIAEETMKEQTEAKLRLHESVREYLKAREICLEKLKDDDIRDSSGMLI